MKKLLLLTLATIVVLGAGVAVTRHYKNYQNQKTHQAQVAADASAQKQRLTEQRLAKVEAAYDHERVECEKGKAAYAILITNPKAPKTVQPVCGPAVLQ